MLVVPLAHVGFLLPSVILANHQRSYPVREEIIDNPSGCRMHVVINAPVTLVRHTLHALRGASVTKLALEFCFALVVVLVGGFHRTPVNQNRNIAELV